MYSNGGFIATSAAQPLRFGVSNAEAMRITADGSILINTAGHTPTDTELVVSSEYDAAGTTDAGITLSARRSGNWYNSGIFAKGDALAFTTGDTGLNGAVPSSEAMRIDASGALIVGKTSDDATVAGMALRGNGVGVFTRASSEALYANRLTTDGEIIKFAKNTVTVGSIGSCANSGIIVGTTDVALRFRNQAGGASIFPRLPNDTGLDNVVDLGLATARFDDIFATNGTIQTSDRNEKEAIASLTPTEMLVAARLSSSFKNFKWKSAVAKKGLDAARLHSGIIAQDVQDAFTAEGLDAGDYAMFISNTWWETQTDVPAVEAVAGIEGVQAVEAVEYAEAVEATYDVEGIELTPYVPEVQAVDAVLGVEAVEAVEAADAYTRTDTYDTLEEAPEGATERTRLGVRYPELLAFVAAYSDQRFLTIETRLTSLEESQ
jgi:hypothetical protein